MLKKTPWGGGIGSVVEGMPWKGSRVNYVQQRKYMLTRPRNIMHAFLARFDSLATPLTLSPLLGRMLSPLAAHFSMIRK